MVNLLEEDQNKRNLADNFLHKEEQLLKNSQSTLRKSKDFNIKQKSRSGFNSRIAAKDHKDIQIEKQDVKLNDNRPLVQRVNDQVKARKKQQLKKSKSFKLGSKKSNFEPKTMRDFLKVTNTTQKKNNNAQKSLKLRFFTLEFRIFLFFNLLYFPSSDEIKYQLQKGGKVPLKRSIYQLSSEDRVKVCMGVGNNIKLVNKKMMLRGGVQGYTFWGQSSFGWSQTFKKHVMMSKFNQDFSQVKIFTKNDSQNDEQKQNQEKEQSFSPFLQRLFSTQDFESVKQALLSQKIFLIAPENQSFVSDFINFIRQYDAISCIENKSLKYGNHLPGMYHLSRKHKLTINVTEYREKHNLSSPRMIPETYIISKDSWKEDLEKFTQKVKISDISQKNPWILKPGERSNRGKGIEMGYSFHQIEQYVINFFGLENENCEEEKDEKTDEEPTSSQNESQEIRGGKQLQNTEPQKSNSPEKKPKKSNKKSHYLLIQKYLKAPLLFDSRKFDLRCYALVIRTPQCFRAFWYKFGYARTSSYKYELGSENDNLMMHLTNEAIQVKCKSLF